MDYAGRLEISYYHTIADLNSTHKTYLVQHQESGKIYVKKILDVYNPRIYEYLLERKIAGIPKLYHIYEENGQLTLIEEFISGIPLQEMMDGRTLTLDLIIRFMGELCSILDNLHMLNPPIIHRDIKPSNIMITPYNHAILIDFNAAKHVTDIAGRDTMLLGTKGYAAPEQYGFGSSTPRTDIYALGILLKEMSLAMPVSTGIFDAIISKCTEMNPSDRMKTVRELKNEIEKLQIPNGIKPHRAPAGQNLIPPGFRTKTPWKMLTASVIYLWIFYLGTSINAVGIYVWLEKITALSIMLSMVFCTFNYCNIHQFIPLCANQNRLIRCFGVLLLNFTAIALLFVVMFLLEQLFDFILPCFFLFVDTARGEFFRGEFFST